MAARSRKIYLFSDTLFSMESFVMIGKDRLYIGTEALMTGTCHIMAVEGSVLKPPILALCKGVMTFKKEAKCPLPHGNHWREDQKETSSSKPNLKKP